MHIFKIILSITAILSLSHSGVNLSIIFSTDFLSLTTIENKSFPNLLSDGSLKILVGIVIELLIFVFIIQFKIIELTNGKSSDHPISHS